MGLPPASWNPRAVTRAVKSGVGWAASYRTARRKGGRNRSQPSYWGLLGRSLRPFWKVSRQRRWCFLRFLRHLVEALRSGQRCAFLPLIEDGFEVGSFSLIAAGSDGRRAWCCWRQSRRRDFRQEPRASRKRWKHSCYFRPRVVLLTAGFLVVASGRKHVLARFYDWSRSGSLPLYHKRRFGPRWRPKSRSELIITNTISTTSEGFPNHKKP